MSGATEKIKRGISLNERKRVIALGFFDGVHKGHGALLSRVRDRAEELGAAPTAFTFDAHPSSRITGAVTPLINSAADPHTYSCRSLRESAGFSRMFQMER